jgi:GntR family transcriptional regulator, rspAB operon transcriptional repressor
MPLKPILRSESLAQQAYIAIRRAIRDGEIPRGKMFSEVTFATSLGVSRTPVREALLDLFRDGIVEIVPKRGFRLAELKDADIAEIRLMRIALEQLVVEKLAKDATPQIVRELEALTKFGERKDRDVFALDEEFHMRMAELANLPQVKRSLLGIRGKMYLIASGAKIAKSRTARAFQEHAKIVKLIGKGQPSAAKVAIAEHITQSIDAYLAARDSLRSNRQYAEPGD